MKIDPGAVVEIVSVVCVVAFFAIVYPPAILLVVAAAGLAWSRGNA